MACNQCNQGCNQGYNHGNIPSGAVDLYPSCDTGCTKGTGCTCTCQNNLQGEKCNYCVNPDSISFSGICDPSQFKITNKFWKQFDVAGTVAVPIEKPSIEEIDSIGSSVEIISKRIITTPESAMTGNYEGKVLTGRKLIIEGLLCLSVSYVALVPEQSVHTFHGQIPFSVFIVMPKELNVTDQDIPVPIEDFNFLIDNCISDICVTAVCERSIKIEACIISNATPISGGCNNGFIDNSGLECSGNVGFSLCQTNGCFTDNPVIKGVCPVEERENLLDPADINGQRWTQISIPEVLTIPDAKPDILQVLSVVSRVEIMCQQVIQTPVAGISQEGTILTGVKLLVHGLLRQRITYTSNCECRRVHSAHYDVPICAYIVLPATTNFTEKFIIKTCIEDIYACALNSRQIFKNTTLFIKAEEIKCD